jgi:hypothetical protein
LLCVSGNGYTLYGEKSEISFFNIENDIQDNPIVFPGNFRMLLYVSYDIYTIMNSMYIVLLSQQKLLSFEEI